MTIANENNRKQYTASAGQTTFAYDFQINANDEIAVYQTPAASDPDDTTDILTLTTDYTVTGVGVAGGGNIVLNSGATLNDVITIVRAINFDQQDAYVVGQDHAEQLEASLDKMTMRIQMLEERVARALVVQTGESSAQVLPSPEADKAIAWNSGGTALENRSGIVDADADATLITDTGGFYLGTDVEAALAELQPKTGLWTPTVKGITIAGTGWAFSGQGGYYTRVGHLLMLNFTVTVDTVSGTATGGVAIGGIPFTVDIYGTSNISCAGQMYQMTGVTYTAGHDIMYPAYGTINDPLVIVERHPTTGGQYLPLANLSNGCVIGGSIMLSLTNKH